VRRIALLATAAAVILVLGVAQLVLPGIAEQRLRDRLSRSGSVLDVQVDAFPAIELLWHHADRVVVRMGSYRSTAGELSGVLDQAADADSLQASARVLDAGLLTLRDAALLKHGNQLTASARVSEADLRAAVPFIDNVQPVASSGGRLTLRGTATLLGLTASIDATVAAVDGRLLVQPDVPFGALATVSVFSDPHVRVDDVSAHGTADGFVVAARARFR
jgi:hypothetical protein